MGWGVWLCRVGGAVMWGGVCGCVGWGVRSCGVGCVAV